MVGCLLLTLGAVHGKCTNPNGIDMGISIN